MVPVSLRRCNALILPRHNPAGSSRSNTRRNFAKFSRELLLHNYTLVCMEAVYTNSENLKTLTERKIICKMLQELARTINAADTLAL